MRVGVCYGGRVYACVLCKKARRWKKKTLGDTTTCARCQVLDAHRLGTQFVSALTHPYFPPYLTLFSSFPYFFLPYYYHNSPYNKCKVVKINERDCCSGLSYAASSEGCGVHSPADSIVRQLNVLTNFSLGHRHQMLDE